MGNSEWLELGLIQHLQKETINLRSNRIKEKAFRLLKVSAVEGK